MSDEKVNHSVIIHSVDFDTFKTITRAVNVIDITITYQLPNLAKSWVEKPEAFLQQLVDFYSGEEQWRLKRENKLQVDASIFKFGNHTLVDAELILAVPDMHSFFIIPGQESIKNHGWNPAEVIQLTNLVAYMPMLLSLSNEPDENEKFKLGVSYHLIQQKANKEGENEKTAE